MFRINIRDDSEAVLQYRCVLVPSPSDQQIDALLPSRHVRTSELPNLFLRPVLLSYLLFPHISLLSLY
jgi:hypothetical protein